MAPIRPPAKNWNSFRRRALALGAVAGFLWAWAARPAAGDASAAHWLGGVGVGAACGLVGAFLFQHLCRLLYRLFRPRMRPDRLS